jgi:hypothetical protein
VPHLAGVKYHSTEILRVIMVVPSMWTVFLEFIRFCAREKKWWLLPLVVLLLILAVVLVFTSSSGIVWTLYPF